MALHVPTVAQIRPNAAFFRMRADFLPKTVPNLALFVPFAAQIAHPGQGLSLLAWSGRALSWPFPFAANDPGAAIPSNRTFVTPTRNSGSCMEYK